MQIGKYLCIAEISVFQTFSACGSTISGVCVRNLDESQEKLRIGVLEHARWLYGWAVMLLVQL